MEDKRRSGGWCGWFLVLMVFGAIGFAIFVTVTQKIYESEPDASPVPGHPGAITKKYADALGIAMQFFDIQKCPFPSFPFTFEFLYHWICLCWY